MRARCYTKYPKLMLKALQQWMPWPQEPNFQHLLEPETCLEGCIKNINIFFQMACMLNKIPKIEVKSFQTVDARASGLHLTTSSKLGLGMVSETTINVFSER